MGLAIAVTIVAIAGCTAEASRSASGPLPSSNMVQPDWAATALDLDAAGFDCARATDAPGALRATAGPSATHAQARAQCLGRLERAVVDLRRYDLALVRARDIPAMTRERLHAFAARLGGLLGQALDAAHADDVLTLASRRLEMADVEGQMLAAGA